MDIKLMPEKYKRRGKPLTGLPSTLLNRLTARANLWMMLALIFLVLVVLIYFGLWGYKNSLTEKEKSLERKFEELTGQRNLELEANFMELKENIESFKKFLENRLYSSNLFKILEELTLPQVQFVDFSADLSRAILELKAETINYQTLAKQVVAFEEDERIKKVEFSEVELEDSGRVSSDLRIELNPDFLLSR